MTRDQQQLFDVEPQPWQLDDMDDWVVARVVFSEAPHGPYDYEIPRDLESNIQPGIRVEVPLGRGNRSIKGYCVDVINALHAKAATVNRRKLKPVSRVLDKQPLIARRLLKLANWISGAPIGDRPPFASVVVRGPSI